MPLRTPAVEDTMPLRTPVVSKFRQTIAKNKNIGVYFGELYKENTVCKINNEAPKRILYSVAGKLSFGKILTK